MSLALWKVFLCVYTYTYDECHVGGVNLLLEMSCMEYNIDLLTHWG